MAKSLLAITAQEKGSIPDLKRQESGDVKSTLSFTSSKNKPMTVSKGKKSKGRAKQSLSKHMKSYLGGKLSWLYDEVVRHFFGQVSPLVRERTSLSNVMNSPTKEDYFVVKTGDVKDRLVKLDSQIDQLKESFRVMFGTGTFKIRLPQAVDAYMIATVTSGVVSNVVTVVPSGASEWSSIAALFDEYRQMGVTVIHKNPLIINTLGSAYGGSVSTTYRVTAADPTDSTALASVVAGVQQGVHEVLSLAHGALSTPVPTVTWHIDLPKGEMFAGSGTLQSAQKTWTQVNLPVTYCSLKHYTVQAVTTASIVESALLYHDLEFRLRE